MRDIDGFETMQAPTAPRSLAEALNSSNHGFIGLLHNSPLLVALLCFMVAQTGKAVLTCITEREWRWERLIGSGGMPSAHSAFVTGLATAVAVRDGTNSSTFAIAAVFALIVMYDAVGLRLHTGRQATALNTIISEIIIQDPSHPVNSLNMQYGQLREQLGHTPAQVVAGSLVGFVMALIIQSAVGSAPDPATLKA